MMKLFDDTSLENFNHLLEAYAAANQNRILDDETFGIFKNKIQTWLSDIKLTAGSCMLFYRLFKIAQDYPNCRTKQHVQQIIQQYQVSLKEYIKYCANVAKKSTLLEDQGFLWHLYSNLENSLSFLNRSHGRQIQLAYAAIVLFSAV